MTDLTGTPSAGGTDGEGETLRVLQRVVMPVDRDLDVLKLYVEGEIARGAEALAASTAVEAGLTGAPGDDVGRRSVVVPVGQRVSFATYFNAFPASYWRRWTSVEDVVLRVRARGEGTVIVYRSSSKGHVQRVASVRIDSETSREETFALSLRPFIDGGWYWLDILAGERDAVLERAEWCAAPGTGGGYVRQGRVSLGITTFNRPSFCVDQLLALGRATEVLDVVDRVYVVDQGNENVRDDDRFAAAADALGARLRLIEQPNLGGSGGFSRAMDETLQAGTSDYVLLLDDDVVTETEGILRAVAFSDFARTPTIVGGHMFNLYVRSQLHAYGEVIAKYRWWWEEAPSTWREHDFAKPAVPEALAEASGPRVKTSSGSLRETAWLHRRVDVDYNGWWMCMIPVDVLRKVGLSMPMFIKWDDAEYCVRAGAAGFPTVSLPGMAAWHVPWQDKDDGIDWQAYFHERNRLVTALLHSPYDRGGNLVKESFIITVKHALAMQYSAAELMLSAIEDVLTGPAHMHAGIAGKLAEINALRTAFPDAQNRPSHEEFPPVRRNKPPKRGRGFRPPRGKVNVLASAMLGTVKQLRPVDPGARGNPQVVVPHIDRHWGLLSQVDSALVSSADGTKVAWYQRDPERFRRILRRASVLHARLSREWPELTGRYRVAMDELASPEAWRRTFESAEQDAPARPTRSADE